ncbi:MAG: hypothetical protein PSX80_03150 [bacterium]|nr:hypothetical protein [bacterium]
MRVMKMLTSLAVLFLASISLNAQAVTSVYTSLDDKKCKTIEMTDEEGGSYKGVCPGVAGYRLQLIEGDLRQTVTVVDPKGKEHPLEFWNLTGAFSAVGETAEWRMRGKKPIALIVRLTVNERVDDPAFVKSYLVVAKITPEETCVTHFLAPSRSHNLEARRAGDKAASRPCLKPASE